MATELEPCVSPDGQHVWSEDEYLTGICEVCGDHVGLWCTVEGCYVIVDFVWEKDPRKSQSIGKDTP